MNCDLIKTGGSFTVTVTRVGAGTDDLPFQLFGALDGALKYKQDGALASYPPALFDTTASNTVTRVTETGAVQFIDTVTGNGVTVACSKIPYHAFLEFLASQGTPNDPIAILASTKISYNVDASRQEQLSVKNRGYFETLGDQNIDIDDYFSPDQQQSKIILIDEVINIAPATKINSTLKGTESELVFTFKMQIV